MNKQSNIPIFPKFKNLELDDKPEIELITHKFEPYSDYNFVSLWSYDVKKEILVSKLNNNLIVRFTDYITYEPFYSFLGIKSLKDTIETILQHAKNSKVIPKLKLIPEITILKNPEILSLFQVVEDRNNFDHIYSTKDLITLIGSQFAKKRYKVNLFKRNFPHIKVKTLEINESHIKKKILDVFIKWAESKNHTPEDTIHEQVAIQNLIKHSDKFDLICVGLWDKNKLIGFTITEITHHGYAISHFTKADRSYEGVFEYLYQQTSKLLYENGCYLLNREQDLGIPDLRAAKESWQPIKYLKKFTISHK